MISKYFICSDVHDDADALKAFADFVQAQTADRILFLGDMSLRPFTSNDLEALIKTGDSQKFVISKRKRTRQILNDMKDILKNSGVPFTVIPGNYDSDHDFEDVFGEDNLHKKTAYFDEAKVFGYGGADSFAQHIGLLYQLGEIVAFDHYELYNLLKKENPDISLIHNPPHQLCDVMFNGQHVGTPATAQYITENNPKLILSGHIHEAGPHGNNPKSVRGISGYQNPTSRKTSIVVNPGNLGRFEVIHPLSLQSIQMFDYGTFVSLDVESDGTPKKLVQYCLQSPDKKIGKIQKIGDFTF